MEIKTFSKFTGSIEDEEVIFMLTCTQASSSSSSTSLISKFLCVIKSSSWLLSVKNMCHLWNIWPKMRKFIITYPKMYCKCTRIFGYQNGSIRKSGSALCLACVWTRKRKKVIIIKDCMFLRKLIWNLIW